jgi:hypothetical protein
MFNREDMKRQAYLEFMEDQLVNHNFLVVLVSDNRHHKEYKMEVVNSGINFKIVANNKVEVFLDLEVHKAVLVAHKEVLVVHKEVFVVHKEVLVVKDNKWLHKDNFLKDLIVCKEVNIFKVLS